MNPTLEAALHSWPWDPGLWIALLATFGIYLRGWLLLRRRNPAAWPARCLAALAGGLSAVWLALSSPLEPFAGFLLQVHMLQHLLLMMVAPPLVWLAAPLMPMLAGLPRAVRVYWALPCLRWARLRRLFAAATHPAVALPLYVGVTWLWHLPLAYDWALRSPAIHYAQHVCFLSAGLLFWYPVVRPFPTRPRWSGWWLVPYLLLADVQNTLLSALFTFSPQPLYDHYAQAPRLGGISVLDDQSAAGVLMWVPGSIVFLAPLAWIGVRLMYDAGDATRTTAQHPEQRGPASSKLTARGIQPANPLLRAGSAATPRFDLLRTPWLGAFLRWRHMRLALQVPMLLLALAVICDGLRGPQVAAMNLAGVLPWIHWRGLLVMVLLIGGNFFCLACPFTLPRRLLRRWLPEGRPWPRRLRGKWLAVSLLGVFLWAYDALHFWDSPWRTAWIAIGYFALALAVDSVFRGAAFCKYVCPIGHFNFVQSLVSPLEVTIRDPAPCAACRTQDCLTGNAVAAGCGLQLLQPRKIGNLDCTFCLDCAHACPHDNVGILARAPGDSLWGDPVRSGIGRLGRRPDIAALVLLLVFGAFANAAGMVAPVVDWQDGWQLRLELASPFWLTSAYYLASLVLLPLAAVGLAAWISGRTIGGDRPARDAALSFVYALVPLGSAMWLAHYSFHLLTSYEVVVPTALRFAGDWGWPLTEPPNWSRACCRPPTDWLLKLEIVMLDVGLLGSLCGAYRVARRLAGRLTTVLRIFAPWAALILVLFAVAVWIVVQPMQMRGTLSPAAGAQFARSDSRPGPER